MALANSSFYAARIHPLALEGDSVRQFLKLTENLSEALKMNCVEFAALGQLVFSLGEG